MATYYFREDGVVFWEAPVKIKSHTPIHHFWDALEDYKEPWIEHPKLMMVKEIVTNPKKGYELLLDDVVIWSVPSGDSGFHFVLYDDGSYSVYPIISKL